MVGYVMDCIICFSELGQTECFNCEKSLCLECLKRFVELSVKEKNIPTCWCGETIRRKDVVSIGDPNMTNMFEEILYEKFRDKNYDEIVKKETQNLIMERLRNEKINFYQNLIGKGAIMKVMEYSYKKKLAGVNKKNTKLIEKSLTVKCFKELCDGKLDGDYTCLKCTQKFCKQCEKPESKGHVCKEEDLKNFEFIKTISRCPKCKTFVEKSEGCDLMTCTLCRTNFSYGTGKKIMTGNDHNQNFDLKPTLKLSQELQDVYDMDLIALVITFEEAEPVIRDKSSLYKIKDVKKFAKAYTLVRENFYKRKNYFQVLDDIIANKKNLSKLYLREQLKKIN